MKNFFTKGGKVLFAVGTLLSLTEAGVKFNQGDTGGGGKALLDAAMGTVAYTGGPIGFTIGTIYFVLDLTIGWENAIPSYIEVEKNKTDMRNKKIATFSDFKF